MQCTFRCNKKVMPDAKHVDEVTGAVTPIGGQYNKPVLDAKGDPVYEAKLDPVTGEARKVQVTERGTFVAVELSACNDEDDCHERTAHASLNFNDLTEAAGAEFEAGKEYIVTIVEKK